MSPPSKKTKCFAVWDVVFRGVVSISPDSLFLLSRLIPRLRNSVYSEIYRLYWGGKRALFGLCGMLSAVCQSGIICLWLGHAIYWHGKALGGCDICFCIPKPRGKEILAFSSHTFDFAHNVSPFFSSNLQVMSLFPSTAASVDPRVISAVRGKKTEIFSSKFYHT